MERIKRVYFTKNIMVHSHQFFSFQDMISLLLHVLDQKNEDAA